MKKTIQIPEIPFKEGDKIMWTYKHWVLGETYFPRTKYGVFLRLVDSRYAGPARALVKFDWNKNNSTVPLSELTKAK